MHDTFYLLESILLPSANNSADASSAVFTPYRICSTRSSALENTSLEPAGAHGLMVEELGVTTSLMKVISL